MDSAPRSPCSVDVGLDFVFVHVQRLDQVADTFV